MKNTGAILVRGLAELRLDQRRAINVTEMRSSAFFQALVNQIKNVIQKHVVNSSDGEFSYLSDIPND